MDYSSTNNAEPVSSSDQTNKDETLGIGEYFEKRARVPPKESRDDKSKRNGATRTIQFALDNPSFDHDRDVSGVLRPDSRSSATL